MNGHDWPIGITPEQARAVEAEHRGCRAADCGALVASLATRAGSFAAPWLQMSDENERGTSR